MLQEVTNLVIALPEHFPCQHLEGPAVYTRVRPQKLLHGVVGFAAVGGPGVEDDTSVQEPGVIVPEIL